MRSPVGGSEVRPRPVMLARALNGLRPIAALGPGDWAKLLAEAGIAQELIDDEDARIPLTRGLRLFEMVAERSRRPSLGAEYGTVFAIGGTGAPGFAMISARSVREAMQAIVRFMPLIASVAIVRYDEDERCGTITWSFPVDPSVPHFQFAAWGAAAVVARLALAMPAGWKPLAVEFDCAAPAETSGLAKVFGPGLSFGHAINRLVVAVGHLDRPLPAANENLYRLAIKHAELEQRSRKAHEPAFESAIRDCLAELIKEGRTRLEDLAAAREVSPARLRKELHENGFDFKQLLGDVRKSVAQSYLEGTDLPITEITFALGYSDCSVFTRACHKWFGKSPREVRAKGV